MASEMRRAARSLVEPRHVSFPSHYGLDASVARLKAALEAPATRRGISRGLDGEADGAKVELRDRGRTARSARTTFRGEWRSDATGARLEGAFHPAPGALRFVKGLSVALTLLVLASAWVLLSHSGTTAIRFLIPLVTVLSILGMPLLVLGLSSQREAEEARIAKAIRVALAEEDPGLPPPQKWDDED